MLVVLEVGLIQVAFVDAVVAVVVVVVVVRRIGLKSEDRKRKQGHTMEASFVVEQMFHKKKGDTIEEWTQQKLLEEAEVANKTTRVF